MQILDRVRTQLLQSSMARGLKPTGIYLGRAELGEVEMLGARGIVISDEADNNPRLWGVSVYAVDADSHIGIGVGSSPEPRGLADTALDT